MAGKISFPQVLLERVADSNKITCLSVKKRKRHTLKRIKRFQVGLRGWGWGWSVS